jgi:hypothetical protein
MSLNNASLNSSILPINLPSRIQADDVSCHPETFDDYYEN